MQQYLTTRQTLTIHLFRGFQEEKNGGKIKGQMTAPFKHKYKLKARNCLFICQLKITYLAMYAAILNNKMNND